MQCSTKWKKTNFCYEQKTFLNQPNFGQRIHHYHPLFNHHPIPSRWGKWVVVSIRSWVCTTTPISDVQPHAELHHGTITDLKHGSREWTGCLPRRLSSSSKGKTCQHNFRQHGWQTPEASHPFGFLFTLNFINPGAPRYWETTWNLGRILFVLLFLNTE